MSRARNRADGDFGDLDITNIGAVSLDSIKGDADGNTSLAFSGSDIITITTGGTAAATFNASQAFTAAGRIITDDTTEATSTTDGSLQTDGGLSIVKDAVFGDDVKLLSDASVLSFGADSDVTLTHVADTGILLNSTMAIQFNDASQFINAPSDTVLDINATDEIELNATLVDVNANINVQGTYIGGGLMQTGGSIVIPDAGNIGSASDTNAIGISSGGVVSITATTANTSATDGALTVAGGVGIAADLSIGDDLRLISDSSVLSFGADSDTTLTHTDGTGLTLNSTNKLTFGDAATFIHQSSDGVMTIDGEATIDLNASTAVLVSNDLKLNSDAAVLGFGADTDVTLTHVADTGLLLNGTSQLQFNDASQNITAPSATVLDINATDEIELNATLIDINGNVEISGTTTQTGISTSTAKDVFNAGLSVKNGSTSAGFVEFFEDSDNGTNKLTLIGPASSGDITVTLPSSAGTVALTTDIADEATALAIALG
jgi:hypothetical protein